MHLDSFIDVREYKNLCEQTIVAIELIKQKQDFYGAKDLMFKYNISFQHLVELSQKLTTEEIVHLADLMIYDSSCSIKEEK